jgi:putative inorganic carbon (hco3(-)) transporter
LSEEGLLGFLFVLGVLSMVYIYSYKLVNKLEGTKRLIVIACIVGLTTYYIHGIFNFFLDTDKASVLFWGLIAYIVALDVRCENVKEK